MALNKAQEEAVHHGPGPAMVLAGPGSGKTMVITHRVRNLIEEYCVRPQDILVITFTRAAAREMEERFIRLMNGQKLPVTFGTFHAVFFKILKLAYHFTADSIIRPEQKNALIRQCVREADWQPEDESEAIGSILAEISAIKGDLIESPHYYAKTCPEDVFREICEKYDSQLRESGLIDFDDMMRLCYDLFKERNDILTAWQKRWPYILIDEFQDINRLQYEIVKMMARPANNLFVVGDDDQSIYRFRGARPEIMLGFPRDYPEARQILLNINYRSVPSVVNTANRLIMQNDKRFRKEIRAADSHDIPVEVVSFKTLTDENDFIIRRMQDYHKKGVAYRDMAILYRTNRSPRVMAEQLIRANIPFVMEDVLPNIYEHWIARDILTYMLIGAGSCSRGDFLRIINRPKRYIGRAAFPDPEVNFDSLREYAAGRDWMEDRVDRLEIDIRMLGKMRPWAAVNYIRKGIGYDDFLKEYAQEHHLGEDELFGLLDELMESAAPCKTLSEWLDYMQDYARQLMEKQNRKGRGDRIDLDGVSVMTMHSAKGLEFRAVFLPDSNEGIIPHRRAVLDADIEEERRLFYVAMTRAKSKLIISSVRERFNRDLAPSRFIKETGVKVKKIESQERNPALH